MASIESLERQIRVARGRIQRERNAIMRSGKTCPTSKMIIAREQAFIRVAKQAIEAERMKDKFVIVADHLDAENKFLRAQGW
jgi:hypothetical protein